MEIFETAHILVALNGDLGMTVPLRNVTAAQIAVLQMIHGKDAILDIEPSGVVKRTMRVERARLNKLYSSEQRRASKACPVEQIYPGAAARLFQKLDELDLSAVQFKPGMAPAGLDERDARLTKATEEGLLLADGSVDDEALDSAFTQDDEPMDLGDGGSAIVQPDEAGALS